MPQKIKAADFDLLVELDLCAREGRIEGLVAERWEMKQPRLSELKRAYGLKSVRKVGLVSQHTGETLSAAIESGTFLLPTAEPQEEAVAVPA